MRRSNRRCVLLAAALAAYCGSARADVHILSFTPALASPQPLGAANGWTTVATDSSSGPLTFQYSVAAPNGAMTMIKDFNVGLHPQSNWVAQPFDWTPTEVDGTYQVQVIAKDFNTGESDMQIVSFTVTSPLTGSRPVVLRTRNPLVALFVAPACPAGSTMRAIFQPRTGTMPPTTTDYRNCVTGGVMTFEIAGMYPSTAYIINSQTNTAGKVVKGSPATFVTGALPANIPFPTFNVTVPAGPGDPNRVVFYSFFDVGQTNTYPNVATDLAGNIIWYNYANAPGHSQMMTRPLTTGFIAAEFGIAWTPGLIGYQVLRQVDWAGNLVRETNTGILQQQLLALGAADAGPCDKVPSPPPVGAACLGLFHHDAILTLPDGRMAVLVDIEKIFPPGTQGDTSGLPVDVVGDMIVVLDQNWQAVWYWDSFDPAGDGNGYPQLPVSRPPVLGESCLAGTPSCLIVLLAGPGVAPVAIDWLHANSLYYWPHNGAPAPSTAPGDIIWSSRHQDWVMKIDYKDGAGTGDILWRMGPGGDFSFVNTYNDPWPWFSHQHEIAIENNGQGQMTLFDNGNTRVSPPSGPGSSTGGVPGLGADCGPHDCNNRGMALSFDESAMQVTPLLSVDLGIYSDAMGSAQLLADGNYFFLCSIVGLPAAQTLDANGFAIEIQPAPGTGSGTQVLNIETPVPYRAWQMPSLYAPPIS